MHMADVLSSRESMASVIGSAKKARLDDMLVLQEEMGEDGEEVSFNQRKGRKPMPSEAEIF